MKAIEGTVCFIPSVLINDLEMVAVGRAIEEEIKAQRQGNNQHTPKEGTQKFAAAESAQIAAEKAGFGNKETYRQAKKANARGGGEAGESPEWCTC